MTQALLAAMLLLTAATDIPKGDPASEILRTAQDDAQRMTLTAQVNGRGPYQFTIDTGAERSVVSDSLAAELALPAAGGAQVYGILGAEPVTMVMLDRLRFGRREQRHVTAPVLPRQALGASGFIGLDALAQETVLLDFRRRSITIARSANDAMIGEPDVIVVTGRSRFGQLILTDAHVGNARVYAIVDTGAQNSIGNLAFRKLMGRRGPLDDRGGRIIGVTGAELPAEGGMIPRIDLGALTINGMAIAYADVRTFDRFGVGDKPAILLGMDVLRRFERVAVDFRRRTVRFLIGRGPLETTAAAAASPEGTAAPATL